ncbi:MAG: HAD-IIA family hydrolase [Rhodobiaceae bacterium]|nr:HAD-IIA family hydrolase [Rhodobiaceae bacterium]
MFDPETLPLDAERAFLRYEAVRPRLPAATYPEASEAIGGIGELADRFDVFVLDAYGVLNIGASAVPGAPETVAALQAAGKQVFVLTNGASFPLDDARARYRALGYDFGENAVIASREAAVAAMAAFPAETRWGVAAIQHSRVETLAPHAVLLAEDPADFDAADAFCFLSSIGWSEDLQALLLASLKARPRPLIVGNPDLIAPHEGGFSLEPGFYAHHIADETGIAPDFHGKPFPSVYDRVKARIGAVPGERICMVGDTLHTDVLGGAAAGWRTVLVTGHGLFRGADVAGYIARSGIVPDYIAETT